MKVIALQRLERHGDTILKLLFDRADVVFGGGHSQQLVDADAQNIGYPHQSGQVGLAHSANVVSVSTIT